MANQGGDQLARGAQSAQFPASEPAVTQDKWNEIFPDSMSAFEERLRKRALEEGLTEEQFEATKAEAEVQAEKLFQEQVEQEKKQRIEEDSKIRIRAVQDRIIVQRVETEEKVGRFYVPDESKEKPYEGLVVAVGPGRFYSGEFVPVTVKVGERVVFGKFSGAEVKVGSRDLLVLREEDLFLVKENIQPIQTGE